MKNNKSKISIPNWLKSAILYGLSWSMIFGLNLNFLAWFAFVPLFISLENKHTFWSFFKHAFLFSIVAYFIICHGFTIIVKRQILTITGSVNELLMSSVSFAILYPVKKKFGWKKALLFYPFIIVIWEFVYQSFEHTYGYLMLSHSQSQNLWLIQFIDTFGVLSIGFWVMLFNVLIYFEYKKYRENKFTNKFIKRIVILCLLMLIPPSIYSLIKFSKFEKQENEKVNITLINSNFSILKDTYNDVIDKVNRLTYITDSINYTFQNKKFSTDLYVWHEGAVTFGEKSDFIGFLDTAVNDWQTPLLTGMTVYANDSSKIDRRRLNRAAVIPVGANLQTELSHYNKVRLAAGNEVVPYHEFFNKFSFFPIDLYDSLFFKRGEEIKLVEFKTQKGQIVKIGTPICMEQDYPFVWNEMSRNGAEFFVQLSVESWWILPYFKEQMSFITRLRAIETGKYVARCSNGGKTQFYDSFGRIYATTNNVEGTVTANVNLSEKVTFFSKNENIFPLLCLFFLLIFITFEVIRLKRK